MSMNINYFNIFLLSLKAISRKWHTQETFKIVYTNFQSTFNDLDFKTLSYKFREIARLARLSSFMMIIILGASF